MSIHGILAALLGTSALGGFAPLTLSRANRYYIIGAVTGHLAAVNNRINIFSGIPKDNFNLSFVNQHTSLGYLDFVIYSAAQSIILGFLGLMPTENNLHTMIQETEPEGYGYDYGDSYGD